MTVTTLQKKSASFGTGRTRLTAHWVRVIDAAGQPQLEIRWTNEPFLNLAAA